MSKGRYQDMKVTQLTVNDIDNHNLDIKEMLKQSFEISFPKSNFDIEYFSSKLKDLRKYIVNETGIIFGCKNNDKIIGFVWFFIKNNTFPKTIHVNHFVVSEEFRGKGLGKDLWEKVEEFAINNDIE